VRHAGPGRGDEARDLLRAGAGRRDDPDRARRHDVREPEADPGEHRRPAPGAHDEQAAPAAAALERDLVLDRDVVGEEEDVEPAAERAVGLEGGVLARHGDERDVRAAERRGGRAERARPGRRTGAARVRAVGGPAAREHALGLGERLLDAVAVPVDRDHDVAGRGLGAGSEAGERGEVRRRAHRNLARGDPVAAA
jgi:hypothetical protein